MMKWTGNPYIDIGLATIRVFCGKNEPSRQDDADLARVAGWITQNYIRDPLRSFLTVAFGAFTRVAGEKVYVN
jgi:CRISPR-associated protein Cst1